MAKNLQLVVFSVDREHYGVGIDSVQEIVRVPDVTQVPDAPSFLEGVINLRGKIVPVIDLRRRLRLNQKEKTKSTRVLVIENELSKGLVGLLVDSVSEVKKVAPESVERPPEMISAIGVEYITGVARVEDRLIILLDLGKILSVGDMKRMENTVEHTAEPQAA